MAEAKFHERILDTGRLMTVDGWLYSYIAMSVESSITSNTEIIWSCLSNSNNVNPDMLMTVNDKFVFIYRRVSYQYIIV